MSTTTQRPNTTCPKIPEQFDDVLRPIFNQLPIHSAMSQLVGPGEVDPQVMAMVEEAVEHPALVAHPAVGAGLWLYVNELDRSHELSQSIATPTGSFWHAIMHRREGDFSNSHYWYRKVGRHPAMNRIELSGGSAGAGGTMGRYDAHAFVNAVEKAYQEHNQEVEHVHPELVANQRREWVALFEWCSEH